MEEGKKEECNSRNERLKNQEKTAREGLKNIPFPDLIVVGGNANVVVWIETVRRKFDEVKRHAPTAMSRFIDTVKLSLGDKSSELACVQTFDGITSYIGRRLIKGRQGLESVLSISNMKMDPCLSSVESERRDSLFIRNSKVLLELQLQSFIMEFDLKLLPKYLLTHDLVQNWFETIFRVMATRIMAEQRSTVKLSSMNDRLLTDSSTSFLAGPYKEPSMSDNMEALTNLESCKKDMPETRFLHFVKYITECHPKIATKASINSTRYDIMTEENINRELKGVRRNTQTRQETSPKRQNYSTAYGGQRPSQQQQARATVNVATKAQKRALGLQPRSSSVSCPCPNQNCTGLWTCKTFTSYSIEGMNRTLKQLKSCHSCLNKHDGPCNYRNTHKCETQDEQDLHNAVLCPHRAQDTATVNLAANENTETDQATVNLASNELMGDYYEDEETSTDEDEYQHEEYYDYVTLMVNLEDVSGDEEINEAVLQPAEGEVETFKNVVHADYDYTNNASTISSNPQDSDSESLDLANFSELKQARREVSETKLRDSETTKIIFLEKIYQSLCRNASRVIKPLE